MSRVRLKPSSTTKSLPAPCILVNLRRTSEPVHDAGPDEIDAALACPVLVADVLEALPFQTTREIHVEVELHSHTVGKVGSRGVIRSAMTPTVGLPCTSPPAVV